MSKIRTFWEYVLVTLMFAVPIYLLFSIRIQLSDNVVSGIVYNNQNNSIHNIDFFKHNINKILDKETVEKIAEELGIGVEYKAVFLDDTRAYYRLGFYTNTVRPYFATYFSKDIISQNDNYTINCLKHKK